MVIKPAAVIASREAAWRSMRRGGFDVAWIAASPSAPRNDGERYSNFGRE
jgi:hypothetical protein